MDKKLFLIISLILLVLGLPVVLWALGQRQDIRKQAVAPWACSVNAVNNGFIFSNTFGSAKKVRCIEFLNCDCPGVPLGKCTKSSRLVWEKIIQPGQSGLCAFSQDYYDMSVCKVHQVDLRYSNTYEDNWAEAPNCWYVVNKCPQCGGEPTPKPTPPADIVSDSGWFQVEGGDVHAQGRISNPVPPDQLMFAQKGIMDPGVVSYGLNLTVASDRLSTPRWQTKTSDRIMPQRSYSYYYDLLGSPVQDSFVDSPPNGSGIYYSPVSSSISRAWSIGAGVKAVYLIEGDLKIDKDILVPQDSFLAFIVKGKINIRGSVKQIQGFYLTEGELNTNYDLDQSRTPLAAEGMFVAGNISLTRNLGEQPQEIKPAEAFIFRPDFLINGFYGLWSTQATWQEIGG